jgi:uncharacterized protein (TIGR03084 family)
VNAVTAALAEQHAELAGLLSGQPLGPDGAGWSRASRCEGWTVADVVLHLAQTDELALASATGGFPEAMSAMSGSVDESAALMVAGERGRFEPAGAVFERWRRGAAELDRVLAGCDPHQRVQWVAGPLSARTLATTRLAETWIHTGDVAAALGVDLAATDRLWHVARLAWRTLPYAFALAGRPPLAGPVALRLRPPGGGEPWLFDEGPGPAATVVEGEAAELCLVAARRLDPARTTLVARGPDGAAVLDLVRTYA